MTAAVSELVRGSQVRAGDSVLVARTAAGGRQEMARAAVQVPAGRPQGSCAVAVLAEAGRVVLTVPIGAADVLTRVAAAGSTP